MNDQTPELRERSRRQGLYTPTAENSHERT
jgi:hypothetical protein